MTKEELVATVRKKAGESGFFRACLGSKSADAMANGTMEDDAVLQVFHAFSTAVKDLS